MSDVTRILNSRGPAAAAEWLPLIYQELRRLAASKMAAQPPGHTMQATALVHEACSSNWTKRTAAVAEPVKKSTVARAPALSSRA